MIVGYQKGLAVEAMAVRKRMDADITTPCYTIDKSFHITSKFGTLADNFFIALFLGLIMNLNHELPASDDRY